MSLSNDLKEFTSAFASSYKMFSDAEEKRTKHEEDRLKREADEAYRQKRLDLDTERVRGASQADLDEAERIRKKYTGGDGGGGSFGDTDLDAAAQGIRTIESGSAEGNYGAKGKVITKKDGSQDQALGAYQVMRSNVPQWTAKHFGKQLTADEFLASREAQDAVFKGEFGGYLKKYGPVGAANTWFSGSPKPSNKTDANGTTVVNYGTRFGKLYEQFGGRNSTDVAGTQPKIASVERTAIPPPEGATAAPTPAAAPAKTATYQPTSYEPGDERARLEEIVRNPSSPAPMKQDAQAKLAKLNAPKPQAAIAAPDQQFAEAEPEEEDPYGGFQQTSFSQEGGAQQPQSKFNAGTMRSFTQEPAGQPSTVSAGANRVGGAGWAPRRVGQQAPGGTGVSAIPMPAGVGYGVGQATPGQQALRDRRAAKDAAAAAAQAAAAAPKPAANVAGNQWDPRYGNRPDTTGYSTPWGGKQPGMTTEQLEAMPDSAFRGNPQAFAAMHPGTENYVRWRVGEDAWAQGQRQQDAWSRPSQQQSGYARGGLVRSYREGGAVKRASDEDFERDEDWQEGGDYHLPDYGPDVELHYNTPNVRERGTSRTPEVKEVPGARDLEKRHTQRLAKGGAVGYTTGYMEGEDPDEDVTGAAYRAQQDEYEEPPGWQGPALEDLTPEERKRREEYERAEAQPTPEQQRETGASTREPAIPEPGPKPGTIAAVKAGQPTGGTGRARLHEDESPEKAKARMAERAKARDELNKTRVGGRSGGKIAPEVVDEEPIGTETPVSRQVGMPTDRPDPNAQRAPSEERPRLPGVVGPRGQPVYGGTPSEQLPGRPEVPGPLPPELQPPAVPPPAGEQPRGGYGGRMGAPRGVNAPQPTPRTEVAAEPMPQQTPVSAQVGRVTAVPEEQGPPVSEEIIAAEAAGKRPAPSMAAAGTPPPQTGREMPAIPSPDMPPTPPAPQLAGQAPPEAARTAAATPPAPKPGAPPAPEVATGSTKPEPEPEPVPGKPSPGQSVIAPKGQKVEPAKLVEPGLKVEEKRLTEKKRAGPAVPQGPEGKPDYGTGGHVMTTKDYKEVERTVDPQRRLSQSDRTIAMYQELQDFWLAKGRPDKAAEASLGLTMYNRRAAQSTGGMALAALEAGDTMGAARWLAKGYNYIPNNQSLLVTNKDKDGKPLADGVDYVVLDNATGKEVSSGHADSASMVAMARGVMSGKQFDDEIWSIVNGARGKGGTAAGKPKEMVIEKKQKLNQQAEDIRTKAIEAKQAGNDEEFERLVHEFRGIVGTSPQAVAAARQLYLDAGYKEDDMPPGLTKPGKPESAKVKGEREAAEAQTKRRKQIDDLNAKGDEDSQRQAFELQLEGADDAYDAAKPTPGASGERRHIRDTIAEDKELEDDDARDQVANGANHILAKNSMDQTAAIKAAKALRDAVKQNKELEFDKRGRLQIPGFSQPVFMSGKMIRSFFTQPAKAAPATAKPAAKRAEPSSTEAPSFAGT